MRKRIQKIIKTLATLFALAGIAAFVFFLVVPAFRGDISIPLDFSIAGIDIHLYGLALAFGVLIAWLVARSIAPHFHIAKDGIDSVAVWLVIGGVVGARFFTVIFSWNYFQNHLLEIPAFWQGGWSIYGALVGGAVSCVLYAKKYGVNVWKFFDVFAIALPLGQAIGRWGNFFNQEAYGYPTHVSWKMYVSAEHRPFEFLDQQYFHPTFLYESLLSAIIFILLFLILRFRIFKNFSPGIYFGCYLILYGIARFGIESIRLDSVWIGSLRVNQIVSIFAILIGCGIVVNRYVKKPQTIN